MQVWFKGGICKLRPEFEGNPKGFPAVCHQSNQQLLLFASGHWLLKATIS